MLVGFGSMLVVLIAARKFSKSRLMQYTVHTNSCIISYGSINAKDLWPLQVPHIYQGSIKTPSSNSIKHHSLFSRSQRRKVKLLRTTRFISVSDKWKAKFQQSNNFFIINIIPEESEDEGGNNYV